MTDQKPEKSRLENSSAADLLHQADELLTAGKLEDSKRLLLQAVKTEPDNERTIRLALDVQMRISGVSDEVGAEEIDPDHLLPAFEVIRKELPDNIRLAKMHADALWDGKYAAGNRAVQARDIWQKVLEAKPDDTESMVNLNIYYDVTGDPSAARDMLIRAVKTDPENDDLTGRLVGVQMRLDGLPEEASAEQTENALLPALQVLAKDVPQSRSLARMRADALWRAGNVEESRTLLEELVTAAPDETELWKDLGRVYLDSEMFDQAVGWLERYLGREPVSFAPLVYLAMAYRGLGRHEDAVMRLEDALALEPDNTSLWEMLALAHLSGGDADNAVQWLEKLKAVNPEHSDEMVGLLFAESFRASSGEDFRNRISKLIDDMDFKKSGGGDFYNMACGFSLAGDRTRMLEALKGAIEYRSRYKAQARTDEDFKAYHQDPQFLSLTNESS